MNIQKKKFPGSRSEFEGNIWNAWKRIKKKNFTKTQWDTREFIYTVKGKTVKEKQLNVYETNRTSLNE